MSHLNIKQLKGPLSGATGSTIVFDAGRPKWSGDLSSALQLPKGNSAARPANASHGMMRYNTETNRLEAFEDSVWKPVISDKELLTRYQFRVDFDDKGQLTTASYANANLPVGWSIQHLGINSFMLTHNMGKNPFDLTAFGHYSATDNRYRSRPKNTVFEMIYTPGEVNKIGMYGVQASTVGTYANGHAYIWVLF